MQLAGRVAVVTGAGRGIGAAAAARFVSLGARAEEIVHAAVFIAENDYFSGRCLEIDGGLRF